ncbi:winged helix-turn-helix transcriptional regulator [Mucilaginibacter sp. X5P1]|uniref:winged helix-turn-helix transcriptional regulator n=1 Tax=Mucilaginibacter sp. X5P1 TaxID=2723088 RepID=UPI0017CCC68E|nr:DNA-binding HxlR family transcriptional regulator [Mucilaginibacter sp. X5P1]
MLFRILILIGYLCYPKDTTILLDIIKMLTDTINRPPNKEACAASINAIKDALYALNGKWKLLIIVSLVDGPKRFKEIQRDLQTITPKVLSKELKELELNGFVERKVFNTTPVTVTYELTPYSASLGSIMNELRLWGIQHRKHIVETSKAQ